MEQLFAELVVIMPFYNERINHLLFPFIMN